jgi:hypothetical protein
MRSIAFASALIVALASPAFAAMHGGGGHGGGGHMGGGHIGGFHGCGGFHGGHQGFRGRGHGGFFGGGFVCLPWQAEQGLCYLPGY